MCIRDSTKIVLVQKRKLLVQCHCMKIFLSVSASWQAIMGFTLTNHLSYAAMGQLLDLMKIHVPNLHGLPKSVGTFKKRFTMDNVPPQKRFCLECFETIGDGKKHCSRRQCIDIKADICYFVSVTAHLQQILAGM